MRQGRRTRGISRPPIRMWSGFCRALSPDPVHSNRTRSALRAPGPTAGQASPIRGKRSAMSGSTARSPELVRQAEEFEVIVASRWSNRNGALLPSAARMPHPSAGSREVRHPLPADQPVTMLTDGGDEALPDRRGSGALLLRRIEDSNGPPSGSFCRHMADRARPCGPPKAQAIRLMAENRSGPEADYCFESYRKRSRSRARQQ